MLLATVVLLAAAAAVSSAVVLRAATVASDLRARRDALCARYAAFGGLALAEPGTDAATAAALVDSRAGSVAVRLARRSASWCVLRATARCATATRTLERTMANAATCNGTGP